MPVDMNLAAGAGGEWKSFWQKSFDLQRENFPKAIKKGVKITLGTDAGGFDWKKLNQAKEFEYRSEEHTSELQSHLNLVCRLLLEKKKETHKTRIQSIYH